MANEQFGKGGLFGAAVDYAGLDANTIAEIDGWRWTDQLHGLRTLPARSRPPE